MKLRVTLIASVLIAGLAGCEPSEVPSGKAIDCEEVPRDVCIEWANNAIEGVHPAGAGPSRRVLVSCTVRPPCAADRLGSGGTIEITYGDGETWVQVWEIGSGI